MDQEMKELLAKQIIIKIAPLSDADKWALLITVTMMDPELVATASESIRKIM